MIGSDFLPEIRPVTSQCSECGRWMYKAQEALVSRKNGKVKKVVCCEDCRLEFDARVWDTIATKNEYRRLMR